MTTLLLIFHVFIKYFHYIALFPFPLKHKGKIPFYFSFTLKNMLHTNFNDIKTRLCSITTVYLLVITESTFI